MASTDERRVAVVHAVAQGQLHGPGRGAMLGLSERQVRRLVAAYRHAGAYALRHGNTGRPPAQTMPPTRCASGWRTWPKPPTTGATTNT